MSGAREHHRQVRGPRMTPTLSALRLCHLPQSSREPLVAAPPDHLWEPLQHLCLVQHHFLLGLGSQRPGLHASKAMASWNLSILHARPTPPSGTATQGPGPTGLRGASETL